MSKQALREQVIAERREFRKSISDADVRLSVQIINGLKRLRTGNGIWMGFKAVRTEANPEAAIESMGGQWAFPKIQGDGLEFYLVDKNSRWGSGPFGISEPSPDSSQLIDIHHAEGVLVPGVVFDHFGNRLGYGRAFYDKALANYQGVKVGVAFSVQVKNHELPNESHDVRMDYIATEKDFSMVKGQ